MSNHSENALTLQLIVKDLKLDDELLKEETTSDQSVRNLLLPVIRYLLDHDFERLLQGLYRIDVGEEKVKSILALEKPENIAERLTDEIIAREKQKIAFRKKYSG